MARMARMDHITLVTDDHGGVTVYERIDGVLRLPTNPERRLALLDRARHRIDGVLNPAGVLVRAFAAREIAVFASATEEFSQRNLNCSIDESIARFEPAAALARDHGLAVRGYVSMCFRDPWQGRSRPTRSRPSLAACPTSVWRSSRPATDRRHRGSRSPRTGSLRSGLAAGLRASRRPVSAGRWRSSRWPASSVRARRFPAS